MICESKTVVNTKIPLCKTPQISSLHRVKKPEISRLRGVFMPAVSREIPRI
jgi:hypothetical protein